MASLNGRPSIPERSKSRPRSGGGYNAPENYGNIDDALETLPSDSLPEGSGLFGRRRSSIRQRAGSAASGSGSQRRRRSTADETRYAVPDEWANLDELAAPAPVENISDGELYRHESLEEVRSLDRDWQREQSRRRKSQSQEGQPGLPEPELAEDVNEKQGVSVSRLATQIYTLSYLILFAILGTLARIGLTALTNYPGTPVIFNTVWANLAGCVVMGFLAEDRMLFRSEWGTPTYDQQIERARMKNRDEEDRSGSGQPVVDLAAAKKAHLATKKTIPLYVGLATGFCGSFTTFSSFIRDVFLALSNDMVTPGVPSSPTSRNGGRSFMAMLAVVITTVSLSLSGLFIGAHLALALERLTPTIPFPFTRQILDPLGVVLGWGCWLGAVFLAIFPPHDAWRSQAVFALVFAPLGCLLRFYLSLYLNSRVASFPMGTFTANVLGTAILGMSWDIAHVPVGGVVGCQVLQGIEDGFCGCLTTISTWVAELSSLRRRSAWIYGLASVGVSLAFMIAIMGGLRWSDGYSKLLCKH